MQNIPYCIYNSLPVDEPTRFETGKRQQKLNSKLVNCAFRCLVFFNYITINGAKKNILTYSMEQSPSWEAKWLNLQLIKKFPAFYGTRKFITVLTSSRHLSLSWANSIQSPQPLPTSWRSILILSSYLRPCLPSVLFPSGFPTKTLYTPFLSPYSCRICVNTSFFFGDIYLSETLAIVLLSFYSKAFSTPRPIPKLEDHPLSAVRDCLFNIFAATLHIWRPSRTSAIWRRAKSLWQGPTDHGYFLL